MKSAWFFPALQINKGGWRWISCQHGQKVSRTVDFLQRWFFMLNDWRSLPALLVKVFTAGIKKSTFIHRHRCDHHWRNQWLLTVFSIPGKIYGQMAGCFSGMLTLELITACNARFFPRVSSSIPSWGYFFRVMLRRLWHTSVFFQHRKALTDPQISHSDRPSFFGMGT